MRFLITVLMLAWSAGAATAQAPDASPTTPVETIELVNFEPTRDEAVLEAYIDGVVEAHMREKKTPGVTVSVVQNGKTLFAKGYGKADERSGEAVDGEKTLFRIGSVSKTFVWVAVMMLHERGALDLDVDINQYLKDLQIPDAFGAPITMNHLMSHRAGFEDTFAIFMTPDDTAQSLTDALAATMPKRVMAPGARTSYSNWGTALAAKIVEDVSGVSFETFLRDEILAPLEMTQTTLLGPDVMSARLRQDLSVGYKVTAGAVSVNEPMQLGPYAPVGGMSMSASDAARWMRFLLAGGELDGVRLLAPQTAMLMWSRAYKDRPMGADLAHGFFSKSYRGHEIFGHLGGTLSFLTNLSVSPTLNAGVFVSQNSASDPDLVFDLTDLVFARLAEGAPAQTSTMSLEAAALSDYVGAYRGNRRSFSTMTKLMSSVDIAMVSLNGDGGLDFFYRGEHTDLYALAGEADVFERGDGNRVVFGRNEKGDVVYLSDSFGVHTFDRFGFLESPHFLNIAFIAAALLSLTTWLGAWRRQGREVPTTSLGRYLSWFDLTAATAVFVVIGLGAAATAQLSAPSMSALLAFPPMEIQLLRTLGMVILLAAGAAAFSLPHAWLSSGWSVWRKLHHSAFVLSLALLSVAFVVWNVVFAPVV